MQKIKGCNLFVFLSPPLPPPIHLWVEWEIEGAKVQGNNVLIAPQCGGKCWGSNIRILYQVEFSVICGRAKSWAIIVSVSPQGGAYTRALKGENLLAPLCRVGLAGAVVTND